MNNEFTGFVYAINRQLTQRAAGLRGTDNAQASLDRSPERFSVVVRAS